MKHAHLGDCPHCQGNLGKEQIHMIVSSPLFQNNSAMLPTIQDDDTLNIGKNQREKEDTPF